MLKVATTRSMLCDHSEPPAFSLILRSLASRSLFLCAVPCCPVGGTRGVLSVARNGGIEEKCHARLCVWQGQVWCKEEGQA